MDARTEMERENAALWEALEHWVFQYRWQVDGMKVEQARIHARSFINEGKVSLRSGLADILAHSAAP